MTKKGKRALEVAAQVGAVALMGQAAALGAAAISLGVGSAALFSAWKDISIHRKVQKGCPCGAPVAYTHRWGARCVKTGRMPDDCQTAGDRHNRAYARKIVSDTRRAWKEGRQEAECEHRKAA